MKLSALIVFCFFAVAMPFSVLADLEITEIMYDLEGADSGREWVEIYNNGNSPVDLRGWKFDDGATSKHALNVPPANGGQGLMQLAANSYAILASNASTFIAEHPGFSGPVIDTVVDLANTTADVAALIDSGGNVVSAVNYESALGGNGDGNSLQKIDGAWKPSAPTPGSINVYALITPPPSDTSGNGNSQTNHSAGESSTSDGASAAKPALPKITVNAVVPGTAIAGADVIFSGVAVGADSKPLQNARFIWNFGDGGSKEGQSAIHVYAIAGDYLVVLDAGSGEVSGGDRHKIRIITPQIIISNVVSGGNGFVELQNKSEYELDLSYWQIKSGGKNFVLPKNTIILTGGKISIPAGVSGIDASLSGTALLFPNGAPVTTYNPIVQIPAEPKPAAEKAAPPEKSATQSSAVGKNTVPSPAKVAAVAPKTAPAEVNVLEENLNKKTSSDQTAAVGNVSRGKSIYPYLLALGGIIVVSLGALAFAKNNDLEKSAARISAKKDDAVEEFDIEIVDK